MGVTLGVNSHYTFKMSFSFVQLKPYRKPDRIRRTSVCLFSIRRMCSQPWAESMLWRALRPGWSILGAGKYFILYWLAIKKDASRYPGTHTHTQVVRRRAHRPTDRQTQAALAKAKTSELKVVFWQNPHKSGIQNHFITDYVTVYLGVSLGTLSAIINRFVVSRCALSTTF